MIEIRDALLLLAPYRRDDTATDAKAAADQAGLTGTQRPAAIEAAEIVAALYEHARLDIHPDEPPPGPARAAADLDAEIAWLGEVADAVAHSPIVAMFRRTTIGDSPS